MDEQFEDLKAMNEAVQKRVGEQIRELDFSESDSEDESNAPVPAKTKSIRFEEKKGKKSADVDMVRPNIRRRNTCGTLYVGTTMSAPDKDATIRVSDLLQHQPHNLLQRILIILSLQCVSGVYRAHIL